MFKPPTKIRHYLRSVKDNIPLRTQGVYEVPCSCGSSYIGQTKRSIGVRLNEHVKAVRDKDVNKSAIYQHLVENDTDISSHSIRFDQAKVISTDRFYTHRLVREAIEIKRRRNFNRDDSLKLSPAWDPVLNFGAPTRNAATNSTDTISIVCQQGFVQTAEPDPVQRHRYNLRSGPR